MKEKKSKLTYGFMDGEEIELTNFMKTEGEGETSLVKSIINTVKSNDIQRLAFETDPAVNNAYQALYIAKTRLIPDSVLKRVSIQDELVATIVRARQQHVASFGHPRPDRFSLGFIIEPNPGVLNEMDSEERHELGKQIKEGIRRIWHCGSTEGWRNEKKMTFAQCLSLLARSAVVVGRVAVERIFTYDECGVRKFHSFRPIDGGTIYKATPQKQAAASVREQARLLLQQLNSNKLLPEKFNNDEYAWVQLIDGRPFQAFTSEECAVYNFYPAPDVELGGYPITPIDTTISAIATHINITTHNKLYFQNGRATKGMLVIKSDDANPQVVHNIKQFFNASINNVNSSWRMPVFGCGTNEEIGFQQIETSTRDMEFQYLTDMNARVIMGAFMISPDELPGWGFLSKGTGSQALSESNNSYTLEAARDTGMRPLLFAMEDFFNMEILPYIDQDLAKKCRLRFVGLDSDNAEKEAVRLQQDQALHLSYDDILERVEKKPLGAEFGGRMPLNQAYKAYLDQFFTVGEILEKFCGREGASKDPELAYRRDPYFFQWIQFQQQKQMMEAQQQQAQQQAQAAQQQGGQGGQGGQPQQEQPPAKKDDAQSQDQGSSGDFSSESKQVDANQGDQLARSIDQAVGILTKSEKNLSPSKRKLLAAQKKTVDSFLKGWEEDLQEAQKEIVKVAEHFKPKK